MRRATNLFFAREANRHGREPARQRRAGGLDVLHRVSISCDTACFFARRTLELGEKDSLEHRPLESDVGSGFARSRDHTLAYLWFLRTSCGAITMKYASVFAMSILLGLGSASVAAAQDRGRSSDDDDARVIVRDDDRPGRAETGGTRGRGADDDDRRRGRTGDVERDRTSGTIGDILGRRSEDDRRNRPRRGDDDWDDDDWDDDDWDDRRDRRRGEVYRRGNNRGGGPAFCRSGEGHPVFGRAWCREKGFGLGGYDDGYWERRRPGDIYFPHRRGSRTLGGSILEDILGRSTYNQLNRRARDLRVSGPIRGRWSGDSEIRVYAGNDPFARIVDLNGDRRADVIYLRR